MTEQEQKLADDKMRAEIVKLQMEISDRIPAEVNNINRQSRLYLVQTFSAAILAAAAIIGATAAITTALLS